MTPESHRLGRMLRETALGRPPTPDGTLEVLCSPPGPVGAVVALTARNVIAVDLDPNEIRSRLDPEDLGGAHASGVHHVVG